MSDEKLDLILNVVSDIKNRQENLEKTVGQVVVKIDRLETRFDGLETRFDGLETRFDGLETRFDGLETRFDGLETRFDGLETRLDGLEGKVDNLGSEFKNFKKQVGEAFASVQNRFVLLEKQMVAIGVELKAEIKQEIRAVGVNIERLEKQVIYDRSETLVNREMIRELDDRLTKIENQLSFQS